MDGQFSVLHVSQPTDYGVARCVAALAEDQVRRGWRVTVACPVSGGLAKVVTEAGAVLMPWEAGREVGPAVVGEIRRLRSIVGSVAPSVVHLHSSKAGLAGRLALRGSRPTLFHTHAWSFLALDRPFRWAAVGWERHAARWADFTICCSQGEANQGRAVGIGGRTVVVPNAVDVCRFGMCGEDASHAARADLGVADSPLAVCVGRLAAQKGQDLLLSAWPTVRAAVPTARLVLVGDGPTRHALSTMVTAGVELAGRSSDVSLWLAAADVVVLPSRYDTTPLTLLEAMAMGRSVVAFDVPGVGEVITGADRPVGAAVPFGDCFGLAREIATRLSDARLRRAEGSAGREHVQTKHNLSKWLDTLAELTRSLDPAGSTR